MIAYYWCSLHIWHLLVSFIKQVQYWLFEDLFSSNMFQATETAFNLNSVHLKCSFYTFLPFAFSCQRLENRATFLAEKIENKVSMTIVLCPYFRTMITRNYIHSQSAFQ